MIRIQTLDVGAGLNWGDIYKFLDTPDYSELGVVGGDPLVGASGWLLGVGYSLISMDWIWITLSGFRSLRRVSQPSFKVCQAMRSYTMSKENLDLFKAFKV